MDFKVAAYNIQSTRPPTNEWTFGGYVLPLLNSTSMLSKGRLKRQEDGSFADSDLANALHDA